MIRPDFRKAPKWARLWLWSPEYANEKGYWAAVPDMTGDFRTVSVSRDNQYGGLSTTRARIWKKANRDGGLIIQIKVSLENK